MNFMIFFYIFKSSMLAINVFSGQCSMIKEELETESNLQNATRSGETSTFSTYSKFEEL